MTILPELELAKQRYARASDSVATILKVADIEQSRVIGDRLLAVIAEEPPSRATLLVALVSTVSSVMIADADKAKFELACDTFMLMFGRTISDKELVAELRAEMSDADAPAQPH